MKSIVLDLENEQQTGLKDRHVDKSGKFKHKTSNQYKLLPFNTKWSHVYYNEFVYFNGVLGEVYRNFLRKDLPKSLRKSSNYHLDLKNELLEKASKRTTTRTDFEKQKFKQFISDMFFENNNLFCFAPSTLPYLSFRNEHATLKQISNFIYEIFLDNSKILTNKKNDETDNNVLYKLIRDALPELEAKNVKQFGYKKLNEELIDFFIKDYLFLQSKQGAFLKYIDALLKHYYFMYVSSIALACDDFCSYKKHELYFLMETEIVSRNRDGYMRGWMMLEKRLHNIFAHVNCLELLNYIKVDNEPIGSYQEIKRHWETLNKEGKNVLESKIKELETYYTSIITKPKTGWEKCYNDLELNSKYKSITCSIEKIIYRFWFIINYQFLHTQRHKPYKDYSLWFIEFCKANFIKRRGRIGHTLKIDQEHLLFLTKLCIGKQPKIRLKTLWEELQKRGVYFDESSKMEVVKLFEKINLIEKKSDSGDAQYVRTIL